MPLDVSFRRPNQSRNEHTAMRMDRGDGKLAHAEIRIGDSAVMLADEVPEMGRHTRGRRLARRVEPADAGGDAAAWRLKP